MGGDKFIFALKDQKILVGAVKNYFGQARIEKRKPARHHKATPSVLGHRTWSMSGFRPGATWRISASVLSALIKSEPGSSFLFEHNLFRKSVPTFRDHAQI
jgi:hypothetical protein